MSTISTAIQLTDRMTSPLRNITNALNMTISAMEKAETAGANLGNANFNAIRHQINSAETAFVQLEDEINNTKKKQDNLNTSFSKVESFVAPIKRLIGAYVAGKGISTLVNESDDLVSTMARLGNMNDGKQSTQELFESVAASANRARGSVTSMADVVARFGNNAGEAFSSSNEVVAFAERVQKAMKVSGASSAEASGAMLQLSQALGSGVLRGDELNSIFEQAPNLIRYIADYMDVPIGKIRELASEGKITADIVKNAIMSDETGEALQKQFDNMPKTWNDTWTAMKNDAIVQLQPVLNKVNELANDESFMNGINAVSSAFINAGTIMLDILNVMGDTVSFVADNWDVLSPIVWGIVGALTAYATIAGIVNIINGISAGITATKAAADMMETGATFAATAAQYGLNTALAACPITWIILGIVAIIAILLVVCNAIAKTTGAAKSGLGVIVGALAVAGAAIANGVIGLVNFFIGQGVNLYNYIAAFANFFANVFDNPLRAVANLFADVFGAIIGVVKNAASVIDAVVGTNYADKLQGFSDKIKSSVENKFGENKEVIKKVNSSDLMVKRIAYTDAFKAGAKLGDKGADKINGAVNSLKNSLAGAQKAQRAAENAKNNQSATKAAKGNQSAADTARHTRDTAKNTAKSAEALETTSENLKYIRDYAAQKSINRYTNTNIKVDMTNNNKIDSKQDINGIATQLKNAIQEEMLASAEGVI